MSRESYIWQSNSWPNFTWDDAKVLPFLGLARKKQGRILASLKEIGVQTEAQILIEDAMKTSAIEGERLDLESIRSSVSRKLGLSTAGLQAKHRHIDGLIDMLIDAVENHKKPLTAKRLKAWQAGLFPTGYSSIEKILVGEWRKSSEPMRVVSGRIGKEKTHFVAPPSKDVPKEMSMFLNWFNKKSEMDGLLRAAVSHLWFVTIHPFEDGNGRVARTITDLALAQDEATKKRCYSISAQISENRNSYYAILERTQKQASLDVTDWIVWFLEVFVQALEKSEVLIDQTSVIGIFWKKHAHLDLNPRQKKVLQKMLECLPNEFTGGMTNRKYVSLNRVSPATAKRDLNDLENLGLLQRNNSKGRSVSYSLKVKF